MRGLDTGKSEAGKLNHGFSRIFTDFFWGGEFVEDFGGQGYNALAMRRVCGL